MFCATVMSCWGQEEASPPRSRRRGIYALLQLHFQTEIDLSAVCSTLGFLCHHRQVWFLAWWLLDLEAHNSSSRCWNRQHPLCSKKVSLNYLELFHAFQHWLWKRSLWLKGKSSWFETLKILQTAPIQRGVWRELTCASVLLSWRALAGTRAILLRLLKPAALAVSAMITGHWIWGPGLL